MHGLSAMKVIVIGGGIGGMAVGAALARLGITADVYEQAPAIAEVGAGVGLWSNALRSLDALGAGDAIRAACRPLRVVELDNERGDVLSRVDLGVIGGDFARAACHVVPRSILLDALRARVPAERVHVGKKCTATDQTADGVRATFADGSEATGDYLIGADGVRSVVRAHVVGADDEVRYSGQTCFRGVARMPPEEPGVIREIQGRGRRCAVCPINDEVVYWWAALNAPAGAILPPAERRAFVLDAYRGWPFSFESFVAGTPSESVLHNDLIDRVPVRSFSRGRMVLVGDAAHPTTPNLGQGANMAIDDAIVLARALAGSAAPFAEYERQRLVRTTQIVQRSWRFGVACRWTSAPAVWLRELAVRATPQSAVVSMMRWQVLDDVGGL